MQFDENLLQDASIFLVGVGGIGCEIIKILIMTDMDLIELTNLNRQFLFRKSHIGKYKSEVAKDLIEKMNPQIKVTAYKMSIYENYFDIEFYRKFDVAIMALDNQKARLHVNKMCHFANIPIIEGGTNSFNGQSMFILPRYTQCYQCIPIQKEKSYQFCTIRSFPSEKIHCLIWAKNFFNDLCIDGGENQIVDVYQKIQSENKWKFICKNFFHDKILTLKDTNEEKYNHLKLFNLQILEDNFNTENLESDLQFTWNISNKMKFLLEQIFKEKNPEGFDKDNEQHVELVCCLSNLRSYNFNLQYTDEKEARQLIGNITPAISSTNSLISGLMVFEFFKFFQKLVLLKQNKDLSYENSLFLLNLNTYTMKNGCPKNLNRNIENPYKECEICDSKIVFIQDKKELSSREFLEELKINISQSIEIFVKNELVLDTDDIDQDDQNQLYLSILQEYLNQGQKIFYCISQNENQEDQKTYVILTQKKIQPEILKLQSDAVDLNKVYLQQKNIAKEKKMQQYKKMQTQQMANIQTISVSSVELMSNKKILDQLFYLNKFQQQQILDMKQCAA